MPVPRRRNSSSRPVWRQNPLKASFFAERLKELAEAGADPAHIEQISNNFNTEDNDATHALYIFDWYRTRLAIDKYESDPDANLQIVSRYAHKYKIIDYADLTLDGEFQIDYFDVFLHFAQLAHVRYVFRRLTWDFIPPSKLIAYLKETEAKASVTLHYRPKFHEPVIEFPNGWAWVVLREEDRAAEAGSLNDCATPNNHSSYILSLREPVGEGYYQTKLRAEVNLPQPFYVTLPSWEVRPPEITWEQHETQQRAKFRDILTPSAIRQQPSVVLQLRKYHNHHPFLPSVITNAEGDPCPICGKLDPDILQHVEFAPEEAVPYIAELLKQPWICWVSTPTYNGKESLRLTDLPADLKDFLYQNKPWMFNIRSFNKRFNVQNYPSTNLKELYTAQPAEIVRQLKIGKTDEFYKRLINGIKYQRSLFFKTIQEVLLASKNKGRIGNLLRALQEFKTRYQQCKRIGKIFIRERIDWLLQNYNYFILALTVAGESYGYHHWRYRNFLDRDTFHLLMEYAKKDPKYAETIFKALFDVQISSWIYGEEEQNKLAKLSEQAKRLTSQLMLICLDEIKYSDELVQWMNHRNKPFGSWEPREFQNSWEVNPLLLRKLTKLLSGDTNQQQIAERILISEATEIRRLASFGAPSVRKAARKLIDSIYENLFKEDAEARERAGKLLSRISTGKFC